MLVLAWGLGFPAFSRLTPIFGPAPGEPLGNQSRNQSILLQHLQYFLPIFTVLTESSSSFQLLV